MTNDDDHLRGNPRPSGDACPLTDRVDRYCDGELPDDEQAHMAQHVPTCPACSARQRQTQAIASLFSGARADRMQRQRKFCRW